MLVLAQDSIALGPWYSYRNLFIIRVALTSMIAFQCVHVPKKCAICVHMFKFKTMESPDVGYWLHVWPAKVHHINIAMALLFGTEVWEQIRHFLEGGSVKEEIIIDMIE